jgi:Glyoxalase-like domain
VNTAGAATAVDHLVVAAATLEQGVAWCEALLGITPGPGGKHALMGTHNRLFSVASEAFPLAYFEIVAVDPAAPPPGRPRWFGLDDPALQARIARQPQLVHMVARSTALDIHRRGLVAAGLEPGEPVRAGRDTAHGRLEWHIMLRADGTLLCGGALPTLIQWDGEHPAERMPASGVTLRALSLCGMPEPVRAVLDLRGVHHTAPPGPALRALLATPLGDITLESA